VDVHGTDKSDDAKVTRNADGTTTVNPGPRGRSVLPSHLQAERDQGDPGLPAWWRRQAGGGWRRERLAHGAVIGGHGDDEFTVTRRGGVLLYDDKGADHAVGAGIHTKAWEWKPDSTKPKELRPATGGPRLSPPHRLVQHGHRGAAGLRRLDRVLRLPAIPYRTRLDYRLQYATGRNSFRFIGGITRQMENSHAFWKIDGLASGIETLRWYGLGNETTQNGQSVSFFKVSQNQFAVGFKVGSRFGARNTISVGPEVRWSSTDLAKKPNRDRFIATDRPYGVGEFGMAGLTTELVLDGRDFPGFATKGPILRSRQRVPKVWDVTDAFGRIQGEAP
jgi:hypothetical protein